MNIAADFFMPRTYFKRTHEKVILYASWVLMGCVATQIIFHKSG